MSISTIHLCRTRYDVVKTQRGKHAAPQCYDTEFGVGSPATAVDARKKHNSCPHRVTSTPHRDEHRALERT